MADIEPSISIDYPRPRAWRNQVLLAGQIDSEIMASTDKTSLVSIRESEFLLKTKLNETKRSNLFLVRLLTPIEEMLKHGFERGQFIVVTGLLQTFGDDPYVEAYRIRTVSKRQYLSFK